MNITMKIKPKVCEMVSKKSLNDLLFILERSKKYISFDVKKGLKGYGDDVVSIEINRHINNLIVLVDLRIISKTMHKEILAKYPRLSRIIIYRNQRG